MATIRIGCQVLRKLQCGNRLDKGALYSEVADWLNEDNVPTGPYPKDAKKRNKKWDGRMVARVSHNWILKGVRFRSKQKTRRINETGRYKSERADPKDLLTRPVPHWAFFTESYYDRVIAKVDARNAKYRRNQDGQSDPCRERPKKRTRFPGQTVYCGVCGRLFVFGGHGRRDHLMPDGRPRMDRPVVRISWRGFNSRGEADELQVL